MIFTHCDQCGAIIWAEEEPSDLDTNEFLVKHKAWHAIMNTRDAENTTKPIGSLAPFGYEEEN